MLLFLAGGLALGMVFATTFIAAANWCVQLTLRDARHGVAAAAGIACADALWALFAGVPVIIISGYGWSFDWLLRIIAASVFAYVALSILASEKLRSLHLPIRPTETLRASGVFGSGLFLALAVPVRFVGFSALFLAVNLHVTPHTIDLAVPLALGVGGGCFLWLMLFVGLAHYFGEIAPEDVALRSLNKLRGLALMVVVGLFLVALAPLVPGF